MPPRNWSAGRARVREEGRCRACARPGDHDPAHIIARARTQPGLDYGDQPTNFVALCRACHRSYDRQGPPGTQLDLLPFLDREEQATAVLLAGGILNALERVTGCRWAPATSANPAE